MPGLDDRRADEHVVPTLPEVDDDLFERAFVHAAVRDGDPCLGDELAEAGGGGVDRLDPVVDPEHLAFAEQLAADRLDRHAFVVLADVGEDRLAIGRGGLQQRQVTDADEAHLERAGDRGRRQREHVDVRLELLDLLLVLDTETLLLVDDQQAQVLERDVGREQAMGADDAVDLAGLQVVHDLLGLGGGQEP